jgi:hypothetical protein
LLELGGHALLDGPALLDAVGVGDGIVLVLPVVDAVRVRTGESGEAAIW